jgi:hypothetical protein
MERRYDMDWLRVLAFGLLILYHVGMFFVPWGWHIKNNWEYEWLQYPMVFLNRWRMPLLFIISGMGTYFSLGKRTGGQFAGERILRLLVPLVFGILVIVPPQVYIERIAHGQFTGSYLDFWPAQAFIGEYPTGNLSWHHLWFLPYILVYSLVLLPVFLYLRPRPNCSILNLMRRLCATRFGLYWLAVPLLQLEWFLDPFFPITHGLVDDWFNLVYNLVLFLYGYLLVAVRANFWQNIQQYYRNYLAVGIMAFICFITIIHFEDGWQRHFPEAVFNQVNMLSWVFGLFGLAATYLNKPSKAIAYCNRAVYPFYILHQTVIIVLAYFIINKDWALAPKFLYLSVGTFGICWLLYEFVIRRIDFLHLVMGVKAERKKVVVKQEVKNRVPAG